MAARAIQTVRRQALNLMPGLQEEAKVLIVVQLGIQACSVDLVPHAQNTGMTPY